MEKTPLKYLWYYVKIFKYFFLGGFFSIVAAIVCNRFYPYYLAEIYNLVSSQFNNPEIWTQVFHFAFLALILGMGNVVFNNIPMLLHSVFAPQCNTLVIRDAFDYVNRHSIAYFNDEMSGNIANKVNLLSRGVGDFFFGCFDITHTALRILITIIVLSFVSGWFFVVLSVWLVIIIVLSLYLGKKRAALSKERSRSESQASGMVVDSLANYSEIKSFANFRFERLNLLKYLRILRKAESREARLRVWIHLSLQFISVFSIMMFVFISIFMLKAGEIDTVGFIYANTLFMDIAHTVFATTWQYSNVTRIFGQLDSALSTLSVEPEIVDRPDAGELKAKKVSVSFENVSFSYKDDRKIFNGLNVEIRPGEKVGLVGASGAGKSTFIKLLARYFDVTGGAVKINGIDIRDLKQDSLHKNIATIPQDVCLFNRTLFDNIRYGKTNAGEQEVIAAAKKASADEFIRKFPDGYKTRVGDRGVILSGGERQRIAIARAILKNAPLLIFDEATSALDSESEKHIQKSLSRLMKNKTVIAIAHRLSTLREMDRILVFKNGKIVEEGTHESLLRKKGVYARLYKMQAGGFV